MKHIYLKTKGALALMIRHGIVSLACGLSEYGLFVLMYYTFHLNINFSYFLPFIVSVSINLLGHSFFTFKTGFIRGLNLIFYVFQVLIVIILGYLIFNAFIKIGLTPSHAKILQLIVTFLFNVIFGRFITFKS
jgi:putative flippase GtrA